ncbi:hypothetical protein C9374_011918 [Naegleria lovaniensis]|uniref:Uncharacterized protein n=1 Tax=Naegleria lovaniensis TaxID=51637 RepID=A0AA88GDS9_NAELO|nr:uncharacterized protein C9374_011918 [Naegleria lovaniensis]KAG2373629.1 hypothetical protein C9374_011918 [Naegleria lovaniensis]
MGRKKVASSSSSSDNTEKSECNNQGKTPVPFVFHKITEYFLKELGSLQFSFKPAQCQEILSKIIPAPFTAISKLISSTEQDNSPRSASISTDSITDLSATTSATNFNELAQSIANLPPVKDETPNKSNSSDTLVLPAKSLTSEITEIRINSKQNFVCTHKGPICLGRRKLKLCIPEKQKIGAEFLLLGINESCEIQQSVSIHFIGKMRETKGSEAKTKSSTKNSSPVVQEFECDTTTYKVMKTCKKCRLVLIRLPSEASSNINEELNVYISSDTYPVLPDGGKSSEENVNSDLNRQENEKERKRKLVEGKRAMDIKKIKIQDEDDGTSTEEEDAEDAIPPMPPMPPLNSVESVPGPYVALILYLQKSLDLKDQAMERMERRYDRSLKNLQKLQKRVEALEKANNQLTKTNSKLARAYETFATKLAVNDSLKEKEIGIIATESTSTDTDPIPTAVYVDKALHVDDEFLSLSDLDLLDVELPKSDVDFKFDLE